MYGSYTLMNSTVTSPTSTKSRVTGFKINRKTESPLFTWYVSSLRIQPLKDPHDGDTDRHGAILKNISQGNSRLIIGQ